MQTKKCPGISEEALRDSETRYRELAESIKESLLVFNKQWIITYANSYSTETLGLTPKDIIGKNVWETFPKIKGTAIWENYQYVMNKRESRTFEIFGPYNKKWFEIRAFPCCEGITVLGLDITERKKTEEKLRVSEERFSKAFNASPIAIAISRQSDGLFIDVNGAYEEIFGFTREEVIGKTSTQLKIFTDSNQRKKLIEKVREKGRVLNVEVSFKTKSGKIINTLSSLETIKVNDENYTISTILDITERKKDQEVLKETEQRLKLITENSRDGINLLDLKTGKYVYMNPAQVALTGFTAEEINGISAQEAYERTHPDDRQITIDQQKKITSGQDISEAVEYRWKVKSGEYRWFSDNRKLVSDEKGQPIALVGISRDITERKKTEEELKKVEWDLNRAQAVGKIGSWRLDTQRNVLLWSDENHRIFGVPKGTPMTYEAFLAIVHPEDREYVDTKWKAGLRGQPYDVEHRIVVDGKVKWVRERAELEFDKDGILNGGFGTTQDITDVIELRRQIEFYTKHLEELVNEKTRQLKDSERLAAIGTTAGMVGHDIRNPLQAIIGDVYLLKDYISEIPDNKTKTDANESLVEIEKNINYINKIVADLQDFAKQLTPKYSKINLYKLVTSVFRSISIPEDISPHIEVDQTLEFDTDPILLQRTLTNLIINALQAMPKGGKLTIGALSNKKKVKITVKDTGEGIPEHVKPKLFTPMMTTKAKGQGLGLAVVKKSIEAMGGAITLESQEGKGTQFIIELPANSQS